MNNDRLKYRVWHKEEKRYVTGSFSISPSGHLHKICGDEDGVYELELNTQVFAVEQCTGLRDKNSTLIYEADVVNAKWGPNIIKSAVVKHKRSGAFILEDGGRPLITIDKAHDIEIIGNIHEMGKACK